MSTFTEERLRRLALDALEPFDLVPPIPDGTISVSDRFDCNGLYAGFFTDTDSLVWVDTVKPSVNPWTDTDK